MGARQACVLGLSFLVRVPAHADFLGIEGCGGHIPVVASPFGLGRESRDEEISTAVETRSGVLS
jgi:hypothetical protein